MEVIVIAKDELRINEEIRAREVRVNTVDGEQLGIMPLARALELAAQHHLDLVEIAPKLSRRSAESWIMASTSMNSRNGKKKPASVKRPLT